ncbi:hypothetical protein P692DRAFT_201797651 [Suillus brevipes Sb2]|nr:hypothetical protein P692DRAFT_201797651 [Suillus brevipes Sb2]
MVIKKERRAPCSISSKAFFPRILEERQRFEVVVKPSSIDRSTSEFGVGAGYEDSQ